MFAKVSIGRLTLRECYRCVNKNLTAVEFLAMCSIVLQGVSVWSSGPGCNTLKPFRDYLRI